MKSHAATKVTMPAAAGNHASAETDPFLAEVTALMPALRTFGYSLCRDPMKADDLVQDTVLKAHLYRQQFQPSSNLKAWLFRILRNLYYSDLRRRKFEIADPEDAFAESVTLQVDHSLAVQLEEVHDALQRLPEQQRDALMLVHVVGLEYGDVAQKCGVALGTIKSRIARARASLHRRLDDPVAC